MLDWLRGPRRHEDPKLGSLVHRKGSWWGLVKVPFLNAEAELRIVDGPRADLSRYHPMVERLGSTELRLWSELLEAALGLYSMYAAEDVEHSYPLVASPKEMASRLRPRSVVFDESANSDWSILVGVDWPNPHNLWCINFLGEELLEIELAD